MHLLKDDNNIYIDTGTKLKNPKNRNMILTNKRLYNVSLALATLVMGGVLTGCKDTESYSDLLRDEEKAVNWFLAQKRVEASIPEDGNFEVGENAPFYRMDEDGSVYMQIVDRGDMADRPEEGDKVYFRFQRQNIKMLYSGAESPSVGNMDNLDGSVVSTFLFYGNTSYPSTTQFGTGIQVPLEYVGFYSEVNLVLKSYSGFTGSSFSYDQSQCIPYLVKLKYYKPEY